MTLWIIFRSPLMMGGNLMEADELILKLLTNDEALVVNQQSSNNHELRSTDNEIIWVADGPERGVKYAAVFNIGDDQSIKIKINWKEIGLSGRQSVRDIWKGTDLGFFNDGFEALIVPHGSGLFKIK
jgi:hypothetical protein